MSRGNRSLVEATIRSTHAGILAVDASLEPRMTRTGCSASCLWNSRPKRTVPSSIAQCMADPMTARTLDPRIGGRNCRWLSQPGGHP
jgi:hypothetical protein